MEEIQLISKNPPKRLKKKFAPTSKTNRSLLEGVPDHLPPLQKALEVTKRVSQVGFDWPDPKGILDKFEEEVQELRLALSLKNRRKIREEIGDLFFVLVNLSRYLHIDPENALDRTIAKFVSRFHYIETSLQKRGKTIHQSNLPEMDLLWEEAKGKKRCPSGVKPSSGC